MTSRCRWLVLVVVAAAQLLYAASASIAAPEIWLGPVGPATDQYQFPLDATAEWSKTLDTIGALALYIRPLADRYNDKQRRALAAILRDRGIKFAGVTAGIDTTLCTDQESLKSIGRRSAERDFEKIKVWLQEGGFISALALDGPVRRVLYSRECQALAADLAIAGREIATYLGTMTALLASVGNSRPTFHLIVNFPNWDFDGIAKPFRGHDFKLDYSIVLREIVARARDNGTPFEALEIDDPGRSRPDDRMHRLVQQARSYGLKIGMMFNTYSQTKHAGPKACSVANGCNPRRRDYLPPDDLREQTFLSDVLSQIAGWRATMGETPDYAIIMSWMMHPRSVLPETTFGTLSYDVLAAKQALDGTMPPIFAQRAPSVGSVRVEGDRLVGWAYDPDEPATSIYVHIYKDTPAQRGQFNGFVASIAADKPSNETNRRLGITGKHGFSWQIPQELRGRHNWYVYSADVRPSTLAPPGRPGTLLGPGPLVPLANSPVTRVP
jgi:hypothetical protein